MPPLGQNARPRRLGESDADFALRCELTRLSDLEILEGRLRDLEAQLAAEWAKGSPDPELVKKLENRIRAGGEGLDELKAANK